MTLFRDYTFHWWQFSLLKLCILALGILVGSYWHEYFHGWRRYSPALGGVYFDSCISLGRCI